MVGSSFFLLWEEPSFVGTVWSCLQRKGSGFTHELGFLFFLVWSQYASVCPSVDTPVLRLSWGSPGLLRQVRKAPFLLFNPYLFFCLLWVSFCWPFSAFPFLLLFLGCQFKCISKTFIQHFYFCSKKDRVSLAHFLVKKYILNLACCFLKATIINKLKIPFYCEFLVNTILTEICLILWMHLIEHLYFFILKWTINAKINIVNMNVFHKLDPLCIYYCLVSF